MPKDIDDYIKFNTKVYDYVYIAEKTLTPPLPKDETVYDLNNGATDFSSEGVEERADSCLEQRKDILFKWAKHADDDELSDIRETLDIVNSKINKDKIHDRFEILDL